MLTYVSVESWSLGLTIVRISEMLLTGSSMMWFVFSGIMMMRPIPLSIARSYLSALSRGSRLSVYSVAASTTGAFAHEVLMVLAMSRLRVYSAVTEIMALELCVCPGTPWMKYVLLLFLMKDRRAEPPVCSSYPRSGIDVTTGWTSGSIFAMIRVRVFYLRLLLFFLKTQHKTHDFA